MEQETKYIDSKKILSGKTKLIGVRLPQYIVDDLDNYSILTGANTTEIVTDALNDFFRYKVLTNDVLFGYGNLFFKLPLDKTFKSDAIRNRIKLNTDTETTGATAPVTIAKVTNNLDVFNGDTYFAGTELAKRNVKHIGSDFVIIPEAISVANTLEFNKLDVDVTDALYVFYYEITSVNIIDVYLIKPIDAVNRLAGVNSINANEKLVSCLQELDIIERGINESYSEAMQELHDTNKNVSSRKEYELRDKYYRILQEDLTKVADKYNSSNIKIGTDANKYSIEYLKQKREELRQEQDNIKNIIENENS